MGLPPREGHTSGHVGAVRDRIGLLGSCMQAVPSRQAGRWSVGGAHRAGMNDVHAGHAPEGLMDPADSWGTLGTHVVAARGSPGA